MVSVEDRSLSASQKIVAGDSDSHDCRFYTNQPAPTQWVAIGVVAPSAAVTSSHHRMLVGTGRTEAEAISALRRRCR